MIHGNNISYAHKKSIILKAIDISVEYGEFLAIVGPNGAGKSTLLNVLANEIEIENDAVLFKDRTFPEWTLKELAHNKAKFSQQNSQDIPLLVEDVVMMGRYPYFHATPTDTDKEATIEAMREVDVWHLKSRNYNTLSGGERQRVHLARVLAQLQNDISHKLIFLDEPLNNLDVKHQHNVLESVKAFTKKGNTAIVVLHDLNLAAQFADAILLMKGGGIEAHGKPSEVFTREIISKAYNFPCLICPNPLNNNPLIVFGNGVHKAKEAVQKAI